MHAALTELHAERADLALRLELVDTAIAAVRKALRLPDDAVAVKPPRPVAPKPPERATPKRVEMTNHRERILSALIDGPVSPGELADLLGMTVSAASYHYEKLVADGL